MDLPSVTIITLNWNGLADTLVCLKSLYQIDYPNFQIIVVDNGTEEKAEPAIRSQFPDVTLIENEANLGFTGGNNVGLRRALAHDADYALLLNNDTEVAPDFLRLQVEAAEADPAIGIVGPTIYYFDRPDVIWSAGGAIDWDRGRTFMIGLDEVDQGQFGHTVRPVDFVTGCALLIKMSVVEQVGMLDPRFFAYYEEAEWCVRVARAGFRILHVPQAKMWHKITPSARASSPAVHYYMTRNRLLFLKVTGAGPKAWFHTLVAEYLRTLISWSVKARWRHKRLQRSAMIQAIADARRGRWGRRAIMCRGT